MFNVWLLAPIGNDTLAHFASAPMVVLIFAANVSLARSIGASTLTAVLAGVAISLSQPIVSQIDKGKDDLFLAAFFAVAAAGLSRDRLRDPLGPWRVGVAIGLCLATKYTALLAMPMLLVAIDAPLKRDDRPRLVRFAIIVLACVALIAGPWFLRNLVTTGNPLFPTDLLGFKGLFSTARSEELGTFEGVMGVLLSGPFAIPGSVALTFALAWIAAIAFGVRRAVGHPIERLVIIGPMIGVCIFLFMSPYPEIRFIVPALILVVASVGLLPRRWAFIPAAAMALAAIATGLDWPLWAILLQFIGGGVAFVVLGVGGVLLQTRVLHWRRDRLAMALTIPALLVAGYAYVNWSVFIRDREVAATESWAHDGRGKLWAFIRHDLPAGPIAYTGTFTVYPLMGYHLDRPAAYAPVKPGVRTIADLPRLGDHLPGEKIQTAIIPATIGNADRDTWLANLRDSGAKYLVVFKKDIEPVPVEADWARGMTDRFSPLYADDAGAVYQINTPR